MSTKPRNARIDVESDHHGINIVPHCAACIAAKARTRLSCSGRSRSYAPGHSRTHSIGIRRMPMQVAAIMPTKTGVLTLCRSDLRGTARPAWACANWKARRNATRWDGQVYCCQHLHTNAPDEDGRVHSSRDLVWRCCAMLRRLHYRDVDNRRCYMRCDPAGHRHVREEQCPSGKAPSAELSRAREVATNCGQGHLLTRAAAVARCSERDEGITLRPQPETLRLCSG